MYIAPAKIIPTNYPILEAQSYNKKDILKSDNQKCKQVTTK